MRPLVSVVCACFNISKYLDEAIASIYAQGYPNLELIVVDDGSTDDTYERLALSLIHISEPTRHFKRSRMPSSA